MAAAVTEVDIRLIVGDDMGVVVLDALHRIGAQGVLLGHLQAGGGQVGLHVAAVAHQAHHPLLHPLADQVQDGADEVGAVLHLDDRRVLPGGEPVLRRSYPDIGAVEHGGAAGEQQGRQKQQGQQGALHRPHRLSEQNNKKRGGAQ